MTTPGSTLTSPDRIDLTPGQLRVLIGIVRGERMGRRPQRPGRTTKKKIMALEKRGLVKLTENGVVATDAGHELVEEIGV